MSVLAGERDRNIAETYVAKEHLSQYLQKLLANDTSCTECRVLGFELSAEELQTIAYALTENKHMKALSLDHLKIGDDGAKHIAQGICYNQSLTFLSLRWNNIGNEGGVALAEALHYNTTIKHLVLSFNRLGHSAGKAFATAITANNTLESLELKWNQIDDEAGDLLLDALSNNKGSLSTLLLGGNGSSLRNTRKDGIGKNANRSKSMRFLSRRQEGKKTEGTTVSLEQLRRDVVTLQIEEEDPGLVPRDIVVGDTVEVTGDIGQPVRKGKVRYLGPTQFAAGTWAGIEFEGPIGKNNGTVDGIQYFSCAPMHGSFLKPDKLVLVE